MFNWLKKYRLRDIASELPAEVLAVKGSSSVHKVLSILSHANFPAAAVVDQDGDPIGSIDMLDLVTYTVLKVEPPLSPQRVEDFLHRHPIRTIINISGRNRFSKMGEDRPVSSVLALLSQQNIHRVFLTNLQLKVSGLVTEMDLLRFLYEHREKMPRKFQKKVKEVCGPNPRAVVTVSERENMYAAFRTMFEKNVSGLGVVNKEGVLIGNISAADIKNTEFQDPAAFVFNLSSAVVTKLQREPVVVKPDDTIEITVKRILNEKVHRVYLVDDKSHPQSVISLGNLIELLNS